MKGLNVAFGVRSSNCTERTAVPIVLFFLAHVPYAKHVYWLDVTNPIQNISSGLYYIRVQTTQNVNIDKHYKYTRGSCVHSVAVLF
jgi:hypothetical protein